MTPECWIAIGICILLSVVAFVVCCSNKEQKKQIREAVDQANVSWARCLAAVEKGSEKETNALKYSLACKDELIAEKDERIKELEREIALKDFVMGCAKVDGSIDVSKLKNGLRELGIHVSDKDSFWKEVKNAGEAK